MSVMRPGIVCAIVSQRDQIPVSDADSQPPTITLLPGEVVEFVRAGQ